jgi:hypothetical protein
MNQEPTIPRLTARPLPTYRYVPGHFPHPVSDPAGHSFGHSEPAARPLAESNWRTNEAWLWAIDLFNAGFYWESHEAWESLWHAAGHRGGVAEFLKGLIKLAAAAVKIREGNAAGALRHVGRARELLAPFQGAVKFGASVDDLLAAAVELERMATELRAVPSASPLRALPVVIQLAR